MNVERAKRLGWIVDNLELQYSQINEIYEDERAGLSNVPEGETAPPSSPPCPASIITDIFLSFKEETVISSEGERSYNNFPVYAKDRIR